MQMERDDDIENQTYCTLSYEELPGLVLTEAADVDLEFESTWPVLDIPEPISESDSENESDPIDRDAVEMPKSSKFTKSHTRNRGATGTSWGDGKPPTELQALDALDEIKGLLRPK